MITNTSTVDNNKIKMVVDKYKPYLCDIDFSVSGTADERISEQMRIYKLIQPSLQRTLRKILK